MRRFVFTLVLLFSLCPRPVSAVSLSDTSTPHALRALGTDVSFQLMLPAPERMCGTEIGVYAWGSPDERHPLFGGSDPEWSVVMDGLPELFGLYHRDGVTGAVVHDMTMHRVEQGLLVGFGPTLPKQDGLLVIRGAEIALVPEPPVVPLALLGLGSLLLRAPGRRPRAGRRG